MGISTNILRKLAVVAETVADPRVYATPDTLIGFNTSSAKQEYEMIEDESIVGVAFKDLPVHGIKKVTGSIEASAEDTSMPTVLAVAFGADTSQVYTMPATLNDRSLSMVYLDQVKTNKYAGCFLNNFKFSSKAGEDLKWSADYIGYIAEVRDDTSFPAITNNPGNRFLHQHLCTNGFFRIGDQVDALAAGDNVTNLESIDIGFNWNFDFQHANSQTSLLPLSSTGGRPEATFEFTISRHSADTYHAWRDARTVLQASAYYYGSATSTLLLEIPNFIINDVTISEDDINKLTVSCQVARNGISTSYSNSNMTFNSPIRATVVNS